jgi:hypothetical protein
VLGTTDILPIGLAIAIGVLLLAVGTVGGKLIAGCVAH